MFTERTSVGLDVHARSVAAAAIDGVTGELFQARLTPSHEHIQSWLAALPGPVAVAYEAGPTGFGLARALDAAGIRCVVAAPSKLQRPSGDRVKTDARDAVHLARLLRLDEVTAVTVPTADAGGRPGPGPGPGGLPRGPDAGPAPAVEAAAAPGHRVLRRAGVDRRARRVAAPAALRRAGHPAGVRVRLRRGADGEGSPGPARRRDHGDGRGQRVHPGRAPAGLPARGQSP